jgi:phosphatidylglycerophosphate synthase
MLKASGSMEGMSVRVGMLFAGVGLTPNQWTAVSLLPAAIGFIALLYGQLLTSALLFLVSGLIDAIDGAVARVTGAVTSLGAFLDGIIDRYVEILMYMGVLHFLSNSAVPELLMPHQYWVALLIFGAMMPTFVRSYADHRNVVTEPEDHKRMGGVMERAERLGFILAGMVLGQFNVVFLIYMVAVTAFLSNLTAVQRIIFVVRFASGSRPRTVKPLPQARPKQKKLEV